MNDQDLRLELAGSTTFYLTPTRFDILINAESMDYLLELWPILPVFINFLMNTNERRKGQHEEHVHRTRSSSSGLKNADHCLVATGVTWLERHSASS